MAKNRFVRAWNILRGRTPDARKFYVCKTYVENPDNGFKGICNLKFFTRDRVVQHCKRWKHDAMKVKVEFYS